jgi:hypothetical protein
MKTQIGNMLLSDRELRQAQLCKLQLYGVKQSDVMALTSIMSPHTYMALQFGKSENIAPR